MRYLAHMRGEEIENVSVLARGERGDATIQYYLDNGSVVAEITGMNPMPGINLGWKYIDGQFVPPPQMEEDDA